MTSGGRDHGLKALQRGLAILAALATLGASQRCPTDPVVLTAREGTIEKIAGESLPLPIFMTCEWRILGGEGSNTQVELVLDEIQLDDDCTLAKLSFFDGPDTSSPRLVPDSCGSGPSAARLVSTGNSLTVVLDIAEKSIDNHGIKLSYKMVDIPEPNVTAVDCIVGTCPEPDGSGGSPGAFWSECSSECGGGRNYCIEPILRQAENGGEPCPSNDDRVVYGACNMQPCSDPNDNHDCILTNWSSWGECEPASGTCGVGSQVRYRNITQRESGTGTCEPTEESQPCDIPCSDDDDDPNSDDFEDNPACKDTGQYLYNQSGTITIGSFQGSAAPPSLQCNWHILLVKGESVVFRWNWVDVSTPLLSSCVGGTVQILDPGDDGKPLSEKCSLTPSDAGSEPSIFFPPGSESAHVKLDTGGFSILRGGGFSLEYLIVDPPSPSPTPSPNPWISPSPTPSAYPKEPVDCVVSNWSEWSECSSDCGINAWRERSRTVIVEPADGGTLCPHLTDSERCPFIPCPSPNASIDVDCVANWTDWGECDAACGSTGERVRTKVVIVEPQGDGEGCGNMSETAPCNGPVCPDPDAGLPAACTNTSLQQVVLVPGDMFELALGPHFDGAEPGYHPAGLSCGWSVQLPESMVLVANMTRMQLYESQACDIDVFTIKDAVDGRTSTICHAAEAGEWTSETSHVVIEFQSAPESEFGSREILGTGFSLALTPEPVHPSNSPVYVGSLSWSIGTGICANKCPAKSQIVQDFALDLGRILDIPKWRVHVPTIDFTPNPTPGKPDITAITVQIVPDYSTSYSNWQPSQRSPAHSTGTLSDVPEEGTAWAPIKEIYRQLTVPESQRWQEPLWSNHFTATSDPATLSVGYADPPKAVFTPEMIVFEVEASDIGVGCGENTKTVEKDFSIANNGPVGSQLAIGGIRFASPFLSAVVMTFETAAHGTSIGDGKTANVKATLLLCSLPEGTVGPVFGTIVVETSDVVGDRDVFVRVDITPLPFPSPAATPSPGPSSTPQKSGDVDWMSTSMLMAAAAGAGVCVIVAVLTYCCCSRLCSGAKKPDSAAKSSGLGPAKPPGSSSLPKRSGSGVLSGLEGSGGDDGDASDDDASNGRNKRGSGRGKGGRGRTRGGNNGRSGRRRSSSDHGDGYGDSDEDGDGIELTGVRLGSGSRQSDDEEAEDDAFASLTVPQSASGSAWQPPSLREGSSSSSSSSRRAGGGRSSKAAALAAASSSSGSSSKRPALKLDRAATLAADAFEGKWAEAAESDFMGGSLTPAAVASPSSIEAALKAANVVCIASGEVGGVQKQYFFAKQTGSGRLFMAEISVTKQSRHLSAMVRAEDLAGHRGSRDDLAEFVKILERALKPLFE